MKYPIITILGPTASGKTTLAVKLSYQIDAEIISADSRQVYRGMDIGTGKDLSEYFFNEKKIPYHLIDIAEAGTEYNVFQYQQDAHHALNEIKKRGKNVVFCGGSGMYIEAVLKGYKLFEVPENRELREELTLKTDEELIILLQQYRSLHNQTDSSERARLIRAIEIENYYQQHPVATQYNKPTDSMIFGIKGDRDVIRQRITHRLKERLENGMIEEVETLIQKGVSIDQLLRYGLEYKFITFYLQNKIDRETLFTRLNIAIHQFSKRQMTWFRKMERAGFIIHWIDVEWMEEEKLAYCLKKIL